MDLQRLIARLEAFYTPDQREFFHQTEQRGGGGKGRSGNTAVRRHRTYFHFYFNATEEMFQLLMKSNWITLPYPTLVMLPNQKELIAGVIIAVPPLMAPNIASSCKI